MDLIDACFDGAAPVHKIGGCQIFSFSRKYDAIDLSALIG
jgi:hypothetical protein